MPAGVDADASKSCEETKQVSVSGVAMVTTGNAVLRVRVVCAVAVQPLAVFVTVTV